MSRSFKPGDVVVWSKQVPGGGYVFPVMGKVLAVTAKRVKIEVDDPDERGEGVVARYVQPASLQHHEEPEKKRRTKAGSKSKKAGGHFETKSGLTVWVKKPAPEKDEAREKRIIFDIVVDAYGPEEQAMGWYYYLEEKLNVPFRARCVEEREVSPLSVGDEVEVVGMPPERECESEMFVSIAWGKRTLAVPLAQLEVVDADEETDEAVSDWHYWVARGYSF
jgi:hypothetical protein